MIPRSRRREIPVAWDKLVLPAGRYCGKLAFTETDAPAALRQARERRKAEGASRIECRWYKCPRCNFCHLTSRETWSPEADHE